MFELSESCPNFSSKDDRPDTPFADVSCALAAPFSR
jgi:hypothetical protein